MTKHQTLEEQSATATTNSKEVKHLINRLTISSKITELDQEIHHLRDVIDETRGSCPHDCDKCEMIETKLANAWWDKIEKIRKERDALKDKLANNKGESI